jgi:hypothetical protein
MCQQASIWTLSPPALELKKGSSFSTSRLSICIHQTTTRVLYCIRNTRLSGGVPSSPVLLDCVRSQLDARAIPRTVTIDRGDPVLCTIVREKLVCVRIWMYYKKSSINGNCSSWPKRACRMIKSKTTHTRKLLLLRAGCCEPRTPSRSQRSRYGFLAMHSKGICFIGSEHTSTRVW